MTVENVAAHRGDILERPAAVIAAILMDSLTEHGHLYYVLLAHHGQKERIRGESGRISSFLQDEEAYYAESSSLKKTGASRLELYHHDVENLAF
jgi:hypothetical protein